MTDFFDFFAVQVLRLLSRGLCRIPAPYALALGRGVGSILFYFSSRRHVAYADLKAALGPALNERSRWKILRSHYAKLGEMLVEILRFPCLDRSEIERRIRVHHIERYFEAIERGQGVILLSAHFGNWELLQIVSGILGRPVHVLARDQKFPRISRFLNELRESHGSVAVLRGIGIRHLLRSLRRRELIGLLGDQDAGKLGGVILPFLGRKTTVPTGAFELAFRTGAPVLPCFIVNGGDGKHEIYVEEAIEQVTSIESCARHYMALLENFIRRFPDQWLWESKRWKYSWTKRLLILSDGKPGHWRQAEAVARQFQEIETQHGRPGMEYPVQKLTIDFKSSWHKFLFSWFALIFIPRAQGCLRRLKFFFTPETFKALQEASADFVISAGASLVPLNLCLARDFRAKSIVLMKPGFPFNLFRYDLAIIPAHDGGRVPDESLRVVLTPGPLPSSPTLPLPLQDEGGGKGRGVGEREGEVDDFKRELRDPARVRIGVFLGGPTRRFQMELEEIEKLLQALREISGTAGDYVLTTSRRTPDATAQFLKARLAEDSACQRLVIAREDPRPLVAPAVMALADILIVSEDSISMISEAVASGKKVVVLSFGSNGLSAKHRRFHEILERESAVVMAPPENLAAVISNLNGRSGTDLAAAENKRLQERLQKIL